MCTQWGECVCVPVCVCCGGVGGTERQKNSRQKTGSARRFHQIISVFDFFLFGRNFLGARFCVFTFSPVGDKVEPLMVLELGQNMCRRGVNRVIFEVLWVQTAGNAHECVRIAMIIVARWHSNQLCVCSGIKWNAEEGRASPETDPAHPSLYVALTKHLDGKLSI